MGGGFQCIPGDERNGVLPPPGPVPPASDSNPLRRHAASTPPPPQPPPHPPTHLLIPPHSLYRGLRGMRQLRCGIARLTLLHHRPGVATQAPARRLQWGSVLVPGRRTGALLMTAMVAIGPKDVGRFLVRREVKAVHSLL